MKIVFTKIRFKNLMSVGNAWTEISLDTSSNTLIVGKNGAGKSILLEAIDLALFGKPYRKINKGQLVNSINQKECLVEIELKRGDDEYLIRRGISPNVFDIIKNGEIIDKESDVASHQSFLEENILGMNMKTFNQIVILGSANYTPFMQLSAAERRQFIEDLLDLNVFTQMNIVLKERVEEHKSVTSSLDSEMRVAKTRYETLDNSRVAIESMAMKTTEGIEKRISLLRDQVREHIQEAAKIKSKMDEITIPSNRKELKAKLEEMNGFVIKNESKILGHKKDAEFFRHHSDCPTCGQSIEEEFRLKSIETRETDIQLLSSKIETVREIILKTKDKISDIDVMQLEMDKLSNDYEMIIRTLKRDTDSLKSAESELKETATANHVFDYSELKSCKEKIDSLSQQIDSHAKYGDVLKGVSVLLKDGGIKAKVIKTYIPVLNEMINHYLQKMNLFADFQIDENFNESIKSRHRDTFSYESFSEGEKLRIDLALLFSWRQLAKKRNSIDTNLLLMDEILDGSLDDQGVKDFLDVVKILTSDCNAVIISHKDSVFDLFDRVIRVSKVSGFSEHTEEFV